MICCPYVFWGGGGGAVNFLRETRGVLSGAYGQGAGMDRLRADR